jgi:hypothetical protein
MAIMLGLTSGAGAGPPATQTPTAHHPQRAIVYLAAGAQAAAATSLSMFTFQPLA